jgi:hypothetical protein
MKGIVAEINGKYAVVLTQTGLFKRVKTSPDMAIGKEIDLNRPAENGKIAKSVMKVTSLAAAGLLALGVGLGAYSYTLPYSYVHVDINPSIELTVNMYDRIIRAEALNAEGEALLSNNDLKNKKVDAGVTRLLNSAVQQGYLNNTPALAGNVTAQFTPDEPDAIEDKLETTHGGSAAGEPEAPQIANAVLVTVSSNNVKKSVNLEKELTDAVSVELDKDQVKSEILVAKTTVEQRNDARRFGVTPGKLVLIEDAMEGKSESELEELKKAAIKDLLVMATNKKMNKEKQAAEQKEKLEKQKVKEAEKRKEEAGKKAEEAAKRKEEAERKAEEAARRKEEAERKAAEAAKKKEEAERKRKEEKAKAQKENNKSNSRETRQNNNSWNQDKRNNQSEIRNQGDKGKKSETKNQENRWNTGKITGQDLKKERERLKDEILNQINNKKKEQDEKRKEQNNQRRNNK